MNNTLKINGKGRQHARSDQQFQYRETIKKNQIKMLEIKNTVVDMKNIFDRHISRPDTVKEKINEVEYTSVKLTPTRIQGGKSGKK